MINLTVIFGASLIALGFIYWKLAASNMVIPNEAEKYKRNAESWRDTCETQICIHVNPKKGKILPIAKKKNEFFACIKTFLRLDHFCSNIAANSTRLKYYERKP